MAVVIPAEVRYAVSLRDGWRCQYPVAPCHRRSEAQCHVLPRRFVSVIKDPANILSQCDEHHKELETDGGRVLLIAFMHLAHGYDYDRAPYTDPDVGYWQRAKELLDASSGDWPMLVNLWRVWYPPKAPTNPLRGLVMEIRRKQP